MGILLKQCSGDPGSTPENMWQTGLDSSMVCLWLLSSHIVQRHKWCQELNSGICALKICDELWIRRYLPGQALLLMEVFRDLLCSRLQSSNIIPFLCIFYLFLCISSFPMPFYFFLHISSYYVSFPMYLSFLLLYSPSHLSLCHY